MTNKTRAYLHTRRDELITEIKALQDELTEIRMALAAIEGGATQAGRAKSAAQPMSIKAMAKSILRDAPNGLPTRDIRDRIKKTYGRDLTPRNMSWHMSQLKRLEAVTQKGERWILISQTNETPSDGESEGASSSTDEGSASSDESRKIDDLLG